MKDMIFDETGFKKDFLLVIKSGIVFCFLAHTFGITNVVKNYDNVAVTNDFGTGITSGRHFLTHIGETTKKYFGAWNLNFFNNVAALVMLIFSAFLIIKIYDIKSKRLTVLWTGIFVTFPTVTSTLFFSYTSHYYFGAVLLVVLAVFFSERYKYGYIISIIFGGISLGIYQAYFPMMISMYVLLLLKSFLFTEKDINLKEIAQKGFYYVFILIASMIFYSITLNLSLKKLNLELSTYFGVDEMFNVTIKSVIESIKIAYKSIILLPFKNYYGLSPSIAMSFCIASIMLISGLLGLNIIYKQKKHLYRVAIIFLFIIIPIALNFIVIMTKNVRVYTLTVYSIVFLFMLPILFIDNMNIHSNIKKTICSLLLVIILGYSYFSNVNYVAMYHTTMQTQNYLNQVVVQAKAQRGFNEDLRWIFVGNINDKLINNPWSDACSYGGNKENYLNDYSRNRWIRHYLGYQIPEVKYEDYIRSVGDNAKILKTIKNMPNYPNDGSIIIHDDYVIIKFSDE